MQLGDDEPHSYHMTQECSEDLCPSIQGVSCSHMSRKGNANDEPKCIYNYGVYVLVECFLSINLF